MPFLAVNLASASVQNEAQMRRPSPKPGQELVSGTIDPSSRSRQGIGVRIWPTLAPAATCTKGELDAEASRDLNVHVSCLAPSLALVEVRGRPGRFPPARTSHHIARGRKRGRRRPQPAPTARRVCMRPPFPGTAATAATGMPADGRGASNACTGRSIAGCHAAT